MTIFLLTIFNSFGYKKTFKYLKNELVIIFTNSYKMDTCSNVINEEQVAIKKSAYWDLNFADSDSFLGGGELGQEISDPGDLLLKILD